MKLASRSLLLAAVALVSFACRKVGPPSPDYDRAYRIYERLYVSQLDDAFGDPQMDEAEALLKKVDPRSVDSELAQRLLQSIADGRKRLAAERAEDEKRRALLRASMAPTVAPPMGPMFVEPLAAAGAPDGGAADAAVAEADAGPPDPAAAGTKFDDLQRASNGCLVPGLPFKEVGTGKQGASYRLNAADPLCGGKLGLGGQLVLVMDGKVYAKVSDKDVKVQNEAPRAVGTQPAQQPAQQPGQTQQQQPAAPAQQPGYAPATPLQAQPADDSNILKPEQPRPSSY